ncbi:enoyl-CoA hydratase/isomerase family protein [Ensifer sp. 4252]|uniref:enoyl-CoA hydratase/isomerase family protein n=1 Tax=Ensifer sp. 4252 TaxID=3373915 RepID=UPI003D2291F3
MIDPRLDLAISGDVAWLTIRRPEKLNAFDADMVDALVPICRAIERSPARVAILTGEGPRSFCAGGDIDAWSRASPKAFARHWVRDGHAAFDALARLCVPLIAVLNGHTLGGGLELAACADLRIAEAHVRIGQPEPGLGIIPGWSGTQRVARRFGAQIVRRMALFGEVYTAQEAHDLGLVDQVVATGEGLAAAEKAAARVIGRSGRAVELTKMLINVAEGEESERVVESFAGEIAAGSEELQEGLTAFREKRPARFAQKLQP